MPVTASAATEQASRAPRYAGLNDGFSKAFEIAFTPAVFCGLGYVADRLAGTQPALMIAFTVFAVVGMFVRLWYRYDEQMKADEASAIELRNVADRRHVTASTTPTFELVVPDVPALGSVPL